MTAPVPPQPLASRRILIVDDQPSIRGVLELALQEAGAEVWTAPDGKLALELLGSKIPDLILLDLSMPNMDGWEVMEAIKSLPRVSGIPVILETSTEDYPSFDRARKLGAAAFISKPFRLGELVETCRRTLDGARPLQGKLGTTPEAKGQRVELLDADGDLLATGWLLDHDAKGAQVDLGQPLALSQAVRLSLQDRAGVEALEAEVRWVTRTGDRYHHGLSFGRKG